MAHSSNSYEMSYELVVATTETLAKSGTVFGVTIMHNKTIDTKGFSRYYNANSRYQTSLQG